MRQTIVITLVLMCSMMAFAQKKETIEIKRTKESWLSSIREIDWYLEQIKAWKEAVDADQKDEWAWRNYYCATDGMYINGYGKKPDESESAKILRKMEAAIPDSYILNLCKCRFSEVADSVASKRVDFVRRAAQLYQKQTRKIIDAGDIHYLALQLWETDPENWRKELLFKWLHAKNFYTLRIMKYNRNMLLSMQPQALYFANEEESYEPMKMIQEALKERQDVIVIPTSFIHSDTFMDALYKKLSIKPLAIDNKDYEKYGGDRDKQYETDVIMYLIKESKRPTYFNTDILRETMLDKDSIYNEGLLLKYSPVAYDNFAVAMHNVKEVYSLEYLAEPNLVYDSGVISWGTDLSNITLLANLISKFRKEGDKAQADRLYNILSKCVERCFEDGNPNWKRKYENMLKEQQETQE